MIRPEQWMDIKDLYRQGLSQRQIARLTGHSRNTIARVLEQKTPQPFQKPARASCLDPFKPYLTERWQTYRLRAPRLLEEIRAQGYTGSINLVQRFLKTLKDGQSTRAKATVRFETAPGQQAQADWAEVGRFEGKKIYAFVMVLSFSRMLYVEFTRSMDLPTLLACHQKAFTYFGGVPASVLYDNMAQVRLPGSGALHPLMADFAAHFGFSVKTHQVRRPRTKGKVERMVEYLKDNFLCGRAFAGFDDLCAQGQHWLEHTANVRLHATTGQRPADLLARERLIPLAQVRPYVLSQRYERKVDVEGFVRHAGARYSVPPQYVGRRVLVVQHDKAIQVRTGDLVIAEHAVGSKGACVADPEHVAAMWRVSLDRTQGAAATQSTVPIEWRDSQCCVAARPLSIYESACESACEEAAR
jgi:transposase